MKNVLIIAPAWVGDMVMAQSLFKSLKNKGADSITVLAPKWTLEVAKRMPEIDRTILGDFAHGQFAFSARKNLGKSLIGEFDTAIVLPKSLKSSFIPFFAKIENRVGYVGEFRYGLLNDARKLDKTKLPKTVDRFVYLSNSKNDFNGLDVSAIKPELFVDINNQIKLRNEFGLSSENKLLALCPGAEYGNSKQWDLIRFSKIANLAIANGYQVIALGSVKDSPIIEEIIKASPNVINLAGKTTITDAIDLLALSDKVLTNDSGLMHIAAAVGSQVYAIYGSTTPNMTPPLSDLAFIIENNNIDCRPCFKRECPLTTDTNKCMETISVDIVWNKMQEKK